MNMTLIAAQLWEQLWLGYRERVPYARIYQRMIEDAQGRFINDHIAFRSLQLSVEGPQGTINLGIPYLDEIVTQLGYCPVKTYKFPDQHLFAQHYIVPGSPDLPKLFISELKVGALPQTTVELIRGAVRWKPGNDKYLWTKLPSLSGISPQEVLSLLQARFQRIWTPPLLSTIKAVNAVSQYGAWVLLHGYEVNHFTASINRQDAVAYPDLESTVQGLEELGIPMKDRIEGSRETGLRQAATQAVVEPTTVVDDATNCLSKIQWPYAYFELAQRYPLGTDTSEVFQGFLSPQAANLFEMTRPANG